MRLIASDPLLIATPEMLARNRLSDVGFLAHSNYFSHDRSGLRGTCLLIDQDVGVA